MKKQSKILITGGAGFIGSHFVRYLLGKYPGIAVTVLDKLTYAGRKENLRDVMGRLEFIQGDICRKKVVDGLPAFEAIFNFAAETHVDRSIKTPGAFVKTDVLGTYNLLELCRRKGVGKFIQISTDEVYGSIIKGSFAEEDCLNPSSPYSSSKAGADLLALSYHKTFGVPVLITRSSNNFGPYQYPEKLIPVLILNALHDKPLPLYGDGRQARDWLYVEDNCSAIDSVWRKGNPGEVYNVGSGNEKLNIEIARFVLKELGKPEDLITFVKDRPAHDRRYSLNSDKLKKLGWNEKYEFEAALRKTVKWYKDNRWWWKPLINQKSVANEAVGAIHELPWN